MELEELSLQEEQAFERFRHKYLIQYPTPSKPKAEALGWQFILLVITSLASVVLASLRTAEQFYLAAYLGGNSGLAMAEAISVMLAIEGGIVIYSAVRAVSKKTFSMRTLGFGIAIMVTISTFAGLGQSIRTIQTIDPAFIKWFQYALSFVIGVGASLIAWIGGDVLGGQIAKVGLLSEANDAKYQASLEEYNQRLLASWRSSTERKIIRGELVRSVDVRSANHRTRPHLPNEGQNEQRMKIFEYIAQTFNAEGRIPGPSEIAQGTGVSKSYAHETRKAWVEENSQEL